MRIGEPKAREIRNIFEKKKKVEQKFNSKKPKMLALSALAKRHHNATLFVQEKKPI